MLRRSQKPVVLCVNKVDSFKKMEADVYEFYNLGIGDPIPVSASNHQGVGDLLELSVIILKRTAVNQMMMIVRASLS